MSASTQAFDRVTGGRRITPQTMDWIEDLIARFGDDNVAVAIDVEGEKGAFDKLLGRVRDRLAKTAAAAARANVASLRTLTGHDLLAIARGEADEPPRPHIADTAHLSIAEYRELLAMRGDHPRPADPALPWDQSPTREVAQP